MGSSAGAETNLKCFNASYFEEGEWGREAIFLRGVHESQRVMIGLFTPTNEVKLDLNYDGANVTREETLVAVRSSIVERRVTVETDRHCWVLDYSSVLMLPSAQHLVRLCELDPSFGAKEKQALAGLIQEHRKRDLQVTGCFARNKRIPVRLYFVALWFEDDYGMTFGVQFSAYQPEVNESTTATPVRKIKNPLSLLSIEDPLERKRGADSANWFITDTSVKVEFLTDDAWWRSIEIVADDSVEGFAPARRVLRRITGWA
jgi:hypothetical protein